jgi:predicted ATPase
VRVLATSREALGVPGEHVVRVRSLSTPDESDDAQIATSDAVRLFTTRAAATGAQITDADAVSIGEICRRLDGIPLAIELAAARVSVMQPSDLAARLDERFRVLTGRRRGAVERHHALRATVDWSYSLLTDDERTAFDRLGVFPATFDADAAIAVATRSSLDRDDVLDALDSLVAKSMLNVERGRTGATRYHMLETIRQYARERLDEDGDADDTRRAHATHFTAVAEQLGPGLIGADELRWRAVFDDELDNLRAAVGWSLDGARPDDDELAVRIVSALELESNSGQAHEVGTWAERALASLSSTSPERRSRVLTAAGWGALSNGDLDRALELSGAALAERADGRTVAPGNAYTLAGLARLIRGDFEGAIRIAEDAIADLEARSSDDAANYLMAKTALPSFHAIIGNLTEARVLGDEAIVQARELGSPSGISAALMPVIVAVMHTDPARAHELVDESIELVHRGARGVVHGYALGVRAQLRAESGDRDGACADVREAVAFSHDRGDRPMLALVFERGALALATVDELLVATRFAGIARSADFAGLSSLPPWERAWAAVAREKVEPVLGADVVASTFAAGMQLSYDEAVTTALADLDALLAEPISE